MLGASSERGPTAMGEEPETRKPHDHQRPGRGLRRCDDADLHLEDWTAVVRRRRGYVRKETVVRKGAPIISLSDAWAGIVRRRAPTYSRAVFRACDR